MSCDDKNCGHYRKDGCLTGCVPGYEVEEIKSQEKSEADVALNDLLIAVVGRIDEHSKEWENAKAAGEEKVMTRNDGKIREGRKISLMIKKIIEQSN